MRYFSGSLKSPTYRVIVGRFSQQSNMIKRIEDKLIWEGILKPKYQKGKKSIVMYHGVDKIENRSFNARFFSARNFEKHLKYYKKYFNVVSLADYFDNRNLDESKVNIAITFDDGYANNLKYAVPLLEKYAIPATFFITGLNTKEDILWADLVDICSCYISTKEVCFNNHQFSQDDQGKFPALKDYIKKNRFMGTDHFEELKNELLSLSKVNFSDAELVDYWKLLSPEEIKTMSNSSFVNIGSHGFYHNNLGNIELSYARDEILRSKEYLESLTQYEICSIGYPDGNYSKELREEALNLGFKNQCAVDYQFEEDKTLTYIENRIGLYPISTTHYINYQIQKF